MNDWEFVNFSEDYELNLHLKKAGKAQSYLNPNTLKRLGAKAKQENNTDVLTHKQFHDYIIEHLDEID
ncbi:MAG: hypothetical protein KGV46_01925 [Pasteurella sp.]|nr:hypothetical protein [Pasteurella sp.]